MYKEATKLKLRFTTTRGTLATEQLWDLSIDALDKLAIEAEKAYKDSGKKSFVVKKSKKDKLLKLKFDIILDILTTKVEEKEEQQNALEVKRHNERIDELIMKKKEEQLAGLSVEELEKLRK